MMNKINYKIWLKIVVWAIVIHLILITISILEVFIYSVVNPNQDDSFYSEHAELTGPYISIFFGFIIFYFVAKVLARKFSNNKVIIAISLPIIYTIIDFLMVHYSGVNWNDHIAIFIVSFLVKALGAFLGVFYKSGNASKPTF